MPQLSPALTYGPAVADWQEGVYNLQAGEPVQAARRLERALEQHRLPAVAHAYLALAWHEMGFDDKARFMRDWARDIMPAFR